MIIEEEYSTEPEVNRIISLFCSNQAKAVMTDRDISFTVRFKQLQRDGAAKVIVQDSLPAGLNFEEFQMRPFFTEVYLGGTIYLFESMPLSKDTVALPETIKAHPKRKHDRIKINGNQFISKMYCALSMKVVDFGIQDEELSKKIHLIINTIESHLMRSENYDVAKVSLFDGTEKNIITRLIKKYKRPFVVFSSADFKIKDDLALTYEDYIKFLSEEGYDLKKIMAQLDKVKEFYQQKHIVSEGLFPLVFEDEVIGQIRVVSLREKFQKAQVRRLMQLSQSAVDNLLDKCSFEVVSKEPQIFYDLSVGGAKVMVTESGMYKYIRLMKRAYIQIFFPDETVIKMMSTIVNVYDPTVEGYQVVGIKFSANMDWRDKKKLDDFIQSVKRLEMRKQGGQLQ